MIILITVFNLIVKQSQTLRDNIFGKTGTSSYIHIFKPTCGPF